MAGQVLPLGTDSAVSVSVVRRVDVDYWLVTGERPLEFEVTADSSEHWLRVYTRLWWCGESTGFRRYQMTLRQGESDRLLSFRTRMSYTSQDASGHEVGEWRSFFVELPTGTSRYRLAVRDGAADTVAVRFAFREPQPWQVVPVNQLPVLTFRAAGDSGPARRYAEIRPEVSVPVSVAGPCRLRVRTRLAFDRSMSGAQDFVVELTDGDRGLARRSLRVSRLRKSAFQESSTLTPSTERLLYVDLGPGQHELAVRVSATTARSAALAIERRPSGSRDE